MVAVVLPPLFVAVTVYAVEAEVVVAFPEITPVVVLKVNPVFAFKSGLIE